METSNFAPVRAVILFFLGMLFLHSAYAQSESNPFDLKYRPANRKPTITSSPVRPIIKDTIAKVETPPQAVREPKPDSSAHTGDSTIGSSDNPFNLRDEVPNDSIGNAPILEEKTETPLVKPVQILKKPSKGIQTFFLLLSLLFLIFVVNVERSFVRDLWRVISNENYSSLHHRNQRNTMRQILLMMGYLVFIIQAGIFLYHVLYWFGYNGTVLDNVWACIGLVLGVYLVRHGVIHLSWRIR